MKHAKLVCVMSHECQFTRHSLFALEFRLDICRMHFSTFLRGEIHIFLKQRSGCNRDSINILNDKCIRPIYSQVFDRNQRNCFTSDLYVIVLHSKVVLYLSTI